MKRILTTTTALSLALSPVSGTSVFAQVSLEVPGGSVICLPDASAECPEGAICIAAVEGSCEGDAVMLAAEQAAAQAKEEAEAAAEAEAAKAAEAEAAKAAEEEAAKAAEAEAAKAAELEAAKAAEAEAAGAAEAEAAKAAEAEAAKAAEAEAAKAAEAEAANAAEAEAAKAAEMEAVKAAEAEAAKAAEAEAAAAAEAEAAKSAEMEATKAAEAETAKAAEAEPAKEVVVAEPVDVPVPEEQAVNALETLLQGATAQDAAPAAAAELDTAAATAEAPVETTTEITAADSRSSTEEFAAAPTAVGKGKKSGLSNLEKFGLVALGALVVGSVLKNGDKVVSNSGDRVVVERDDGSLQVLKDDDTLLRQPGSRLRTENFTDGSSRTILERDDGSRIVTIRDASGRVLRRSRIDVSGNEVLLIDDLAKVERVEVSTLPRPAEDLTISTSDNGASLQRALDAISARENMRRFNLRQIRDYREVRALAPTINVDNITFASGSSAIEVTEAEKLSKLGSLIADVLRDRPYEVFLIEGHTDAVGSASSNLSLSDRRAESVALALTEYFGVPPENLVVQGYGESELRVQTEGNEVRNRRVAVRLISPLMQTAGLR